MSNAEHATQLVFIESGEELSTFINLLDELSISDTFTYNVTINSEKLVQLLLKYGIIQIAKKGYIKGKNFESFNTNFKR